jgi:glucose/arabinose dehydrogenase
MYAHSFLVTSVRGMGEEPTTAASCGLGVIGFMNAAFGFRFEAVFLRADFFTARFRAAGRRADFRADFFADLFADFFALFLVAIASLLLRVEPANLEWNSCTDATQSMTLFSSCNRGTASIFHDMRAPSLLRTVFAGLTAASSLPAQSPSAPPVCARDNGGLALPDGFCAVVVGSDLGPVRHLVVAPNGDVFANVARRGIVALRDTSGDGAADVVRRFGDGGTGIALADGWLYGATNETVYRYRWSGGQLEPRGEPQTIVRELPTGGHEAKSIAVGAGDVLYVNVGSLTNSCQVNDRGNRSPGRDPCRELETRAGIWRFSASRAGQRLPDGRRYATGLRNALGLAIRPGTGELWAAVHGRDQLAQNWGFDDRKSAENPGEELVRVAEGDDFGWPYCYYDVDRKAKVLAPEYGGDGTAAGRCTRAKAPVAVYPGHWAPMALAFGRGGVLGTEFADGVFIALHGSWNRAPLPQAGYRVVWQPLAGDRPAGPFITIATGTAGATSLRASGLAVGPDGSLYIAADANGTIWRIIRASP